MLREQGTFPPQEAFEIAIRVADALEAVHEEGIVHRDLKTPNIMKDRKGVVRLMDFGIAKDQSAGTAADLTGTGMIIGSPDYMSLEQWHGRKADARSDIYALDIVIYELFTGRVPFHADTVPALMHPQLLEPPPLEGEPARLLPEPVLARALAKEPSERFASAAEMAEALREAKGGVPAAGRGHAGAGADALPARSDWRIGAAAAGRRPNDGAAEDAGADVRAHGGADGAGPGAGRRSAASGARVDSGPGPPRADVRNPVVLAGAAAAVAAVVVLVWLVGSQGGPDPSPLGLDPIAARHAFGDGPRQRACSDRAHA